MNERKITLMKAGMTLFAEKGFHKTSVQDIATKAGVSKGAFYLSFESKEEFIGTAIKHFNKEIIQKLTAIAEPKGNPKQLFKKQIDVLVSYVYRYKQFIMMLFHENVSFGRHAEQFYQQMKTDSFYWLKSNIKAIYEDRVNEYSIDAVIQIEGLLSSYFRWIVIDNLPIDHDRISSFIMDRLDDLVDGMNKKGDPPLVLKEALSLFDNLDVQHPSKAKTEKIITNMKETIHELDLSEEQQSKLIEVTDMLKNEQRKVIIQGLLAHFRPYEQLQIYCEQLATLFNVNLLEN